MAAKPETIWSGDARRGGTRRAKARNGMDGQEWHGTGVARSAKARNGAARQEWTDGDRPGGAQRGKAVQDWRVMAQHGGAQRAKERLGGAGGEMTKGIAEALQALRKQVADGRRQTEAIERLWDTFRFTREEVIGLAKLGLRYTLGAVIHGRSSITKYPPGIPVQIIERKNPQPTEPIEIPYTVLDECYPGASGQSQKLLFFTPQDFILNIERFTSQMGGLRRKREAFKFGLSLLEKYKAKNISELPKGQIERFINRLVQRDVHHEGEDEAGEATT